ncbi:MAG: spondin domain-containing protein [Phycisphaerales bacterium]|nr:spondin domain-containing protein [Phycisphaerales bacterium]
MKHFHFNPIRSLLVSTAIFALPTSALAQDSVEYQFEFISEWSAQTHPTSFPSNPHFSSVIGATHTDSVSIWEPGGIATHGIERMAESGTNGTLLGEVNILIDQGNADQFFNMGGIPLSPGQRNSTITVNTDFPLISLVSMIAPSPDWFIGVHDINLREDGIWVRELVFDLDPYDSGTDSGTNYTSINADINPHIPIENIANQFPFTGSPRIGFFRFTLISDAACSFADFAEPYNELNFFDVSAFLSAFSAQSIDADLNDDGEFNFFDVSDFLTALSEGCP